MHHIVTVMKVVAAAITYVFIDVMVMELMDG